MVEFKQKFDEHVTASATKQQTKKVLPFMLIVSGILIIFGIVGTVFGEDSSDFYMGVYMLVLGAVLPIVFFVVLYFTQRAFNKSMALLGESTEQIFTFSDREVTISQTKGDEFEGFTRAKYSFLWKVEETKTHYFLYVSRGQLHVIDKGCITQGTIEEMNSYLMTNLVYKYKQKR